MGTPSISSQLLIGTTINLSPASAALARMRSMYPNTVCWRQTRSVLQSRSELQAATSLKAINVVD